MTKRTCLCLLVLSGIWTSASAQYSKVQPEVNTYTYASKDGEDLQLDVYIDPTFSGTENRPVMIFSYGGAWEGGKKEDGKAFLEEFAQEGYIAVGINYRLGIKKLREKGVQIGSPASTPHVDFHHRCMKCPSYQIKSALHVSVKADYRISGRYS